MRTQEQMFEQTQRYRENNDCTVRALAGAFDTSYGKAHRHLAKHGRPNRKGPSSSQATVATKTFAEKLGYTAKVREDLEGLTLNQFYKDYASRGGIWVVFIKGHAIGFRDGKTLDWTGDAVTGKIVRRKTAKVGYRADSAVIQIK
tara:strand:- start:8716 stop:9150 length:435 start_codon:yes stop_codon:yes gene_type:complete